MPTIARKVGSYIALAVAAILTAFAVQSAQTMSQNERLVDDIVTNAPIGIVVCDKEGVIEACNASFTVLVGDCRRLVGSKLTDLMPEEYRERFDESRRTVVLQQQQNSLNDKIVYTHTRPLLRCDGTTIDIVIHSVLAKRNGELKIFGFVTRKVE